MENTNLHQKLKTLYVESGEEEQNDATVPLEKQTPTISQSVYDSLPTLLKQATDVFEEHRERDVFLFLSNVSFLRTLRAPPKNAMSPVGDVAEKKCRQVNDFFY